MGAAAASHEPFFFFDTMPRYVLDRTLAPQQVKLAGVYYTVTDYLITWAFNVILSLTQSCDTVAKELTGEKESVSLRRLRD